MKKSLVPVLFIFLLPAFFFFSCSKKEDPYERETKEMNKAMSGMTLDLYKAFKVSLRGTASCGKDSTFDRARRDVLALLGYVLSKAADTVSQKVDAVQVAREAFSARSAIALLASKDEDSLATILQNVAYVIDPHTDFRTDPVANLLNESEEHLVLAGTWLGVPTAPREALLYEIMHVNGDSLRSKDLSFGFKAVRSLLYYRNNWPYHAEKDAGDMIAQTEKEKDYFLQNPWPMITADGQSVTPEQAWHQLHGFGFLLRGIAREKMEDKKDDALADMETFVTESEAGGLDNELVWMTGCYVALEKGDDKKALGYIGKLEASKNISDDERDAVKQAKEYIEAKENGKATGLFGDKIVILKIAGNYFAAIFSSSKPVATLKKSSGGQKFFSITHLPFPTLKAGDEVDSLKNKAGSLLKKVGI